MFQYLLPTTSKELVVKGILDRKVLRAFGLDDVLRDVRSVPTEAIVCDCTTPGGKMVVLTPIPRTGDTPNVVHYDPKLQRWCGYNPPGGELPCIGAVTTPTPTFLARRSQVPGYTCEDPQGNKWLVPAVRGHAHFPQPYGAMPCDFDWSPEGEPVKKLSSEYQQLWEDVGQIWDHVATDDGPLDELAMVGIVVRGLQVNYRIGPQELAWLAAHGAPILNTQNLQAFAQSLVDVESVAEFREAKKKEESRPADDGSDSSAG